jgi:hypothetical protein
MDFSLTAPPNIDGVYEEIQSATALKMAPLARPANPQSTFETADMNYRVFS